MKRLIALLSVLILASGYAGGTFAVALEEGSSTTIPSLICMAVIAMWLAGFWFILRQPEKAEVRA